MTKFKQPNTSKGPRQRLTPRVSVELAELVRHQAEEHGLSINSYLEAILAIATGRDDLIPDEAKEHEVLARAA